MLAANNRTNAFARLIFKCLQWTTARTTLDLTAQSAVGIP